jgi:hypothetical protein
MIIIECKFNLQIIFITHHWIIHGRVRPDAKRARQNGADAERE